MKQTLLKDKKGNKLSPVVSTDSVYSEEGAPLSSTLKEISGSIGGVSSDLASFKEETQGALEKRAIVVNASDEIGTSPINISKNTAVVYVGGYARIIPVTDSSLGWLYECSQGWRIADVHRVADKRALTWLELLNHMEEHSKPLENSALLNLELGDPSEESPYEWPILNASEVYETITEAPEGTTFILKPGSNSDKVECQVTQVSVMDGSVYFYAFSEGYVLLIGIITNGSGTLGMMPLTPMTELDSKQDKLVSGSNIKTVNGNSLLGSGNIEIQGGGSNNAVEYVPQNLTFAQREQARKNIDAASETDLETRVQVVDVNDEIPSQGIPRMSLILVMDRDDGKVAEILPSCQGEGYGWLYDWQEGWRIVDVSGFDMDGRTWLDLLQYMEEHSTPLGVLTYGVVRNDVVQSLNDTQKAQARKNIGAAEETELTALRVDVGKDHTQLTNLQAKVNQVEQFTQALDEDISTLQGDLEEIREDVSGKQDTLVAGSGISIEGNVISTQGGGGGSEWRLIADVTFEEQAESLTIEEDADGNPFSLREIYTIVSEKLNGTSSAWMRMTLQNGYNLNIRNSAQSTNQINAAYFCLYNDLWIAPYGHGSSNVGLGYLNTLVARTGQLGIGEGKTPATRISFWAFNTGFLPGARIRVYGR